MAVAQAIAAPVWQLQFPYANGNDGKGNIDNGNNNELAIATPLMATAIIRQ